MELDTLCYAVSKHKRFSINLIVLQPLWKCVIAGLCAVFTRFEQKTQSLTIAHCMVFPPLNPAHNVITRKIIREYDSQSTRLES